MDNTSPAVALVTVRHSGSHSALGILEQYYLRHALTEDWRKDTDATKPPLWFSHSEPENMGLLAKRIAECDTVILTMRNPIEVAKSWTRRNMPMNGWFRQMWRNLFALQEQHNGFWLPVDTPDRDERLALISEHVGFEIQTDWERKGVTGNRFLYREGMTLDEVRAFYKTLPLEEFGYGE